MSTAKRPRTDKREVSTKGIIVNVVTVGPGAEERRKEKDACKPNPS
jgi:hypothetical protein